MFAPGTTEAQKPVEETTGGGYRMGLVDPFKAALYRLPSPFPIETCVARDRKLFSLTVEAAGSFAGCFSPGVNLRIGLNVPTVSEYVFCSKKTDSVSYPITYGALEAAGNNYPTEYGYAQVDGGIFDGLSGMMVSARLLSAAIKITCSAPRDKLSGNFVACSTFVHRPGDMPIMTPGLQSGCTDFIQSSSEDGLVCVWNPQSNSDYDLTQLTSESNSGTHQKASQVFAIFGNGLPVGYSLEFEVIATTNTFPVDTGQRFCLLYLRIKLLIQESIGHLMRITSRIIEQLS